MRRLAIGCAAALFCSHAGVVQAQAGAALSWVREPGAESCIAAPELGRRVQRLCGPVLVAAPDATLSIEGRVRREGAGFSAAISVTDGHGVVLGTREVHADTADCRQLDARVAFVIAVALDPDAALAALPGELSDEDAPEAALLAELRAEPPAARAGAADAWAAPPVRSARSRSARVTEKPPPAPPDPRTAWSGLFALAGAAGAGMTGAPSAGVRAELGVAIGSFSVLAHGSWWSPHAYALEHGAEVRVGRLALGLSGCAPLAFASGARYATALCAGALAARLEGVPKSALRGTPRSAFLLGPSVGLRAERTLAGPLRGLLALEAHSLWPRDRIAVTDGAQTQAVYRPPAISGSLSAGLLLTF